MNRLEKIKMQVDKMLEKHLIKIDKEIENCEEKLHDTMEVYGVGGAYSRQEIAKEKRIRDKEMIQDFRESVGSYQPNTELKFYYFVCEHCKSITMTTSQFPRAYSECPCCGKITFHTGADSGKLKVIDDNSSLLNLIKGKE